MAAVTPPIILALPDKVWCNIASRLPISDAVSLSKSVAKVTRERIFTAYWNNRAENPKVQRPDKLWQLHAKDPRAFPFEMRWLGRTWEDATRDMFATALRCQKWEVILEHIQSHKRSVLTPELLWQALCLSIEMGHRGCFDLLIDSADEERAGELLLKAVQSGRPLYAERLLERFQTIPIEEMEKAVQEAVVSCDCLDLLLSSRNVSADCAGKALARAVQLGLLTAVRILFRRRGDIPTDWAATAFQESRGHLSCQEYLIRNRRDIPIVRIEGELFHAAALNHFFVVQMLLREVQFSLPAIDKALQYAVDKGSLGCVEILLPEYRRISDSDWNKHVINAAWGGHSSCALYLITAMSQKQLDNLAAHPGIRGALSELRGKMPLREGCYFMQHQRVVYIFKNAGKKH